jgi:hypothetical protein
MSAIDQIPPLIQEAENLVMSVVNQRITPDMIPLSIKQHFTLPSLMHAEMVALVTPKGYVIRYRIPKITATFEVIELKTIPFPLGNNLFGKLKLESSLVPISKEGYSFLYTPGMCVEKDTTIMCKSYQVTIHAEPQVCAEQLAFNPATIPNKCQNTMQIVIPKQQDYIYQSRVDLITVFSPYKDTVAVSCAKSNGTKAEHNITAGLTNVQLPPNCKAVTNEMVIFAPPGTDNRIIKMSTITWDMTDNLLSLADTFEGIHSLNVTELESSFIRYANLSGNTEVDFKLVASELQKFKNIESMQQFHPLNIQWHEGPTVSNTVNFLSYGFTLVLFISIVSLCCKCCSCNICEALFKAVSKLFSGAFTCTSYIYKKCRTTEYKLEQPISLSQASIAEQPVNLPPSPMAEATVVEWQIEKRGSRAILYASMPDGNLYFNHLLGKIEDAYGRALNGLNSIKPSAEELMRYLQILDNMPPPKLEKGAPHEHEYVVEDPTILYDRLNRKFYHQDTGKVVSGFKLPPPDKD